MTERLFFIAKKLFKTYKCPERIKQQFRPNSLRNRLGQFVVYSAAFYNWEEQGVSDHEIKHTIQEFVYTSKQFFDQRSKKLASHECPLKSSSLLKDEWEAVLVQDNYQVQFRIAFKLLLKCLTNPRPSFQSHSPKLPPIATKTIQ